MKQQRSRILYLSDPVAYTANAKTVDIANGDTLTACIPMPDDAVWVDDYGPVEVVIEWLADGVPFGAGMSCQIPPLKIGKEIRYRVLRA